MQTCIRALVRALASTHAFSAKGHSSPGAIGFALIFLLAMTHSLWAHDVKAGDIEIVHPWSRATPAGAKVAVGYLVLRNKGAAPDRLVSIASDIAARTEIHEMVMDSNGVMTMRPLDRALGGAGGFCGRPAPQGAPGRRPPRGECGRDALLPGYGGRPPIHRGRPGPGGSALSPGPDDPRAPGVVDSDAPRAVISR